MKTDPLVLSLSKDISSFSQAQRRRGLRQARPERAWVAALGFLIALFFAAPALAQPFPPLSGRVVDQANLLSAAEEARLTADLAALERRTTDQVVIVTVPSLGARSIEAFGRALGNIWGIGQRGKDNGVLLIVAPAERKTRIEVGYGLEAILTNGRAAQIIERDMVPRFRESHWFAGIAGGTRTIIATLIEHEDEVRVRRR